MIPLLSQPKVITKKDNLAIFEIASLYPGYGVTIGNSLRRVLLSSLPGAAATQMKIKGVSHEFSTIPGIIEDVITIMLNVKQLRFKLYSDEPQKAILKVKGEKEVKGALFEVPAQAEIVNKDCHIAALTDKSAELEMEIQIEKGIGYSSREARRKFMAGAKEKLGIGVIPLDAIFTPVRIVSYHIENMRVGERTDFDRLFLEIETDGTITPETALSQASEILVNHFSMFADAFRPEIPIPKKITAKKAAPTKKTKKSMKTAFSSSTLRSLRSLAYKNKKAEPVYAKKKKGEKT